MLHPPRKHRAFAQAVAVLAACAVSLPGQNSEGAASAPAVAGGRVIAVRHWSLGDVTRIAIETDTDFEFRFDRLQNPDRLFFDIVGAKPGLGSRGLHTLTIGDKYVKQIRVAETQHAVTRVVFDLAGPVEFTTSRLENPSRLIIELHAPGAPGSTPKQEIAAVTPAPAIAAPVKPDPPRVRFQPPPPVPMPVRSEIANATQRELPLLDAPPVVRTASPSSIPSALAASRVTAPAPARTNAPLPSRRQSIIAKNAPPAPVIPPSERATEAFPDVTTPMPRGTPSDKAVPAGKDSAGDRSMTRVLGLKVGRIVIDAGHGGHDTGTIGATGMLEKDLVLDVAHRLGALLQDRLGSEIIYTRSDDTFIPLERRTEIANEAHADLFLSIHANSSPARSASGIETYYLSFTTQKEALDVAARENAASDLTVYDLQDLLQKIALKDKVDESREFAVRVEEALYAASSKTNAQTRNRGIKKAPFVVLIGATMPSVLAEIGFISNPHDESLMQRPDHRQKIAEALYKGVASYANTLSHFQVAQRH